MRLTKTERIVLNGLLAFRSDKEIANGMCVATRTVKFHNQNIYRKLHVHGRSELFQKWYDRGKNG